MQYKTTLLSIIKTIFANNIETKEIMIRKISILYCDLLTLEHDSIPHYTEHDPFVLKRQTQETRVCGVSQTLETVRTVGCLVEVEAAEKECCICLKTKEVGNLLSLVSCGHRIVCSDFSALVVGHACPVCRTDFNGDQTGDPCVRLKFPHTGLVGEDSADRRILI